MTGSLAEQFYAGWASRRSASRHSLSTPDSGARRLRGSANSRRRSSAARRSVARGQPASPGLPLPVPPDSRRESRNSDDASLVSLAAAGRQSQMGAEASSSSLRAAEEPIDGRVPSLPGGRTQSTDDGGWVETGESWEVGAERPQWPSQLPSCVCRQ